MIRARQISRNAETCTDSSIRRSPSETTEMKTVPITAPVRLVIPPMTSIATVVNVSCR